MFGRMYTNFFTPKNFDLMVQYRVINRKDDIPMKIYDITDKENAYNTFLRLSNVDERVLQRYINEAKYGGSGDIFKRMLEKYDVRPTFKKDELICHLQHMTTSANGCEHIKEKGLTDLRVTYEDTDSELRQFLDEQGVKIDLPGQRIYFNGEDLGSIEYSKENNSSDYYSPIHRRWCIGHKFYYDFCICGFFSFDHKRPYEGNVHYRPEILLNISQLIGKNIGKLWTETHKTYVVKFAVPYDNLFNKELNEIDDFLYRAFNNAIDEPEENIALLQDHITVPPEDIISIERFDFNTKSI